MASDTKSAGLRMAARKAQREALIYHNRQAGRADSREVYEWRARARTLWELADWCVALARKLERAKEGRKP